MNVKRFYSDMSNRLQDVLLWFQVPLVASNRIGKEVIETEHGPSQITFYGNSFITGINFINDDSNKINNAFGPTQYIFCFGGYDRTDG